MSKPPPIPLFWKIIFIGIVICGLAFYHSVTTWEESDPNLLTIDIEVTLSRNTTSPEAWEVLKFIEIQPRENLTLVHPSWRNVTDNYLMTNDTLTDFLGPFPKTIENHQWSQGESASLSWNLSVTPFNSQSLNQSNIWNYWEQYYITCLSWSANGSNYSTNIIEEFTNVTLYPLWVCHGEYLYYRSIVHGSIEWIYFTQLLFLDDELNYICLAFYYSHWIG